MAARRGPGGLLDRFLASQFARPSGLAGGLFLGPLLDRIGGPMMAAAFEALEPAPGDAILDLGIGGGALVARLLAAGAQVTAVDVSEAMLARAGKRHAAAVRTGQARFLHGSAQALPLEDAGLDKAASVNVLYFWPELAGPLAELARVLRPGGRLVLGFQTAESVRAWPGHVHGFRAWTDAEVVEAVQGAGFGIVDVREARFRWVGDTRMLIALRG